jgi:DNA-directed RNA polymerase subunit E"
MGKDKACRVCRYIMNEEDGKVCPICGSTQFTTFWMGYTIIMDPENSEIAKKMGINRKGKFALRISR